MNNNEEIIMMLITHSGMSRSSSIEAITFAERGDISKADKMIEEAEEHLKNAGKEHYKLISVSMEDDFKVSLLLTHAEDQMLSAETTLILSKKIINIHREK